MFALLKRTILLAGVAASVVTHGAVAKEAMVNTESNAEERVNLSGKLRMLSQRIPSAACHLQLGIDPEGALALLEGATSEFERILTGLEHGAPELNIHTPERGRRVLDKIHELRAQWVPLGRAATAFVDGTATAEDLDVVLTQNIPVLRAAVDLVPQIVQQYSSPTAVPYSHLLLVDIAGRQRMLTQKMSKEACILGTEHRSGQTLTEFETTMQLFEDSLLALRIGAVEFGLLEPPTMAIASGLDGVLRGWEDLTPVLDVILEGEMANDATSLKEFRQLNEIMTKMNEVVGLYADFAKGLAVRPVAAR